MSTAVQSNLWSLSLCFSLKGKIQITNPYIWGFLSLFTFPNENLTMTFEIVFNGWKMPLFHLINHTEMMWSTFFFVFVFFTQILQHVSMACLHC